MAQAQPAQTAPRPAYCIKCKAQREIQQPERIQMKNGAPAVRGVCGTCGSKLFRIRG